VPYSDRAWSALRRTLSPQFKRRLRTLQRGPLHLGGDIAFSCLFGRNLRSLATLYGTNKWNQHFYAQHYETHFRAIRRRRLNVLEIGIGGYEDPQSGGNSLRMWRAYFPRARIFGIDIEDKTPHDERRIKTFRGSQDDPAFLDRVVRQTGPLDIIVDDGSHESPHVLASFRALFPHLVEGGYYAVEDTQFSYWPRSRGNATERNDPNTSMGFLKSLTDGLNFEEFLGDYHPTDLDRSIVAMHFYHNLVIIKKGLNNEGSTSPELRAKNSK
jgi:Cephalosporin hydroxylase